MPQKGNFWSDTFEQLTELGQSTATKIGQAVTQTFSPLNLIDKLAGGKTSSEEKGINNPNNKNEKNKDNHTPLDFNKLQENYQNQDKVKAEALRQRLFQLVKKGEEEAWQKTKQEKLEKERAEAYQSQEKNKKEEERKKQEQLIELPKGKIRRSIFSAKKVAQRTQVEIKPASSKQ